ncbi:hypothetical protein Bhz59_00086 [Stenotrophomonas phage vB_SmaS_Bhz59]
MDERPRVRVAYVGHLDRGKSMLGAVLAKFAAMNIEVVEARVAAVPEEELKAITAEVMKPTTGMREFLKDPDRRYTIMKAGNRKERRTKAKQQRRQRRQHK